MQTHLPARLEHTNLTVSDPLKTAELLMKLFDWTIRWQGEAIHGGFTVHVGEQDTYLALYKHEVQHEPDSSSYKRLLGLNHLGIVVADLNETERRVKQEGFDTFSHADYEPGRRFYFRDADALEFEVIEYD
jgi:catechol 2,3-dioxygenase-like lactoylglutathione lyase family enzyme